MRSPATLCDIWDMVDEPHSLNLCYLHNIDWRLDGMARDLAKWRARRPP